MNRQLTDGRRPNPTKITALYSRLSRDDIEMKANDSIGLGESNSITNQKKILEDYAKKNGFADFRHFCDDGVSGTTFERKGFQEMVAEIEAGNVGSIICKDMSRLGRDYLQVGFYTEIFFRQHGVRFIAISNNIDSENGENNEFAPFLNIMSEWYARDASRKQKATYQSKGHSGKRTTNGIIYGYLKDLNNKTKWIVDPFAADVVRRIFALSACGNGPFQIAKILEADGIETPGAYLAKIGLGTRKNYVYKHPCRWAGNTISNMLEKPEYMGHTVNFRSTKESYKSKKQIKNPKEDWVIFENTHEAIVDPGTWETAQRCRTVVRRMDWTGAPKPLTGILHCADCGGRLFAHRRAPSPKASEATKKLYQEVPQFDYYCPQYSGGRGDCSIHFISTKTANTLILEAIRRTAGYARKNEDEFIKMLREASEVKQANTAKLYKRQIVKNEKRIAELDLLFKKTYEDFAAGRLSEKRFESLSGGYESEQAELEKQTVEIRAALTQFDSDSVKVDKFMELVKRYTDFSELTPTMLHEFVEKVVVHEADKSSGVRQQRIDIYLNYIGQFEVPENYEDDYAPEPVLPKTPTEIQRAKWREYARVARESVPQKDSKNNHSHKNDHPKNQYSKRQYSHFAS